ncbi:MAG: hypothetical protein RL710_1617 [Pseudomonadota bacterium]
MNALANNGEWVARPLIEVATLQRGYDLPVQVRADGPHPIFAANGAVGFHAKAKCRGPGVVTGRSGTIGKVHFVDCDYWPLNTSLYVNDFHGNDPKWVYYMLQSFGLERFSQGAGVPTLNRNLIHGELIRVPPVREQRRIAAILDQADALRAKRREALAQLDSLTQSIFIEMFGDPETNEKGLPLEMLGTMCKRITDGTHLSPKWDTSGVPFLFISNIVDGQITFNTHKFISNETYTELTRRCPIELGDVLYTTVGSYGNAAVVETTKQFAFQRHIAHIKPDKAKIVPLFLAAMIQSTGVRRQVDKVAKGVAQKTVNLADLKNLLVFAPAHTDQQDFANCVQSVEALKVTHRAALQELDRLFASLQHRAFQGEL